MPRSATERFSRTYTPRVPDDSYDSLGALDLPDSIVRAPFEKPFEQVRVTSAFLAAVLSQTLVPSGQVTRINLTTTLASGALQTQAIASGKQADAFQLTTAMAGGTLH